MNKQRLEWVDINKVVPNPKNPRKDHAIKTNEMENIINTRGWEEGIVCYKKNQYFTIISGHRRWYTARKIGIKEVPIYIVRQPDSEAEELERLGSIQSGQKDWNPYEWMTYVNEVWAKNNYIPYANLAKKLNLPVSKVANFIRVYNYYNSHEIEGKLINGTYTLNMLEYIRVWLEKLKKNKPSIVEALGNDTVRGLMLKKYEVGFIDSHILNDTFVRDASEYDVLNFITTNDKNLWDVRKELKEKTFDRITDKIAIKKIFKATNRDIFSISINNKKNAGKVLEKLSSLEEEVKLKIKEIEEFITLN